jgi:hypothetical protein
MAQSKEVRLVKLETQNTEILSHLMSMDAKMDGLDKLIRGNGKPGLLTTQTEHELRIQTLEDTRKGSMKSWRELSVLIISGGVIALLTAAVQHFVR